MAIGMTSSAWAVNNDINPLTGAPSNEIPAIPDSGNAAPAPSSPEVSTPQATPEDVAVDNNSKVDTDSEATKEEDEEDYNYDVTENVLKKTSNLSALIELEKKKKELKDLRHPPKDNTNQQNAQLNGGMPVNQQGYPIQQQQPIAPVVEKKAEEPKVDIQATAVYSLGNTTYAEIFVNGNKFVAKSGTPLPNGYRIVGVNSYGVTLKKGNTKVELPIVSSEAAAKAADLAASNAVASRASAPAAGPVAMPPLTPPSAPISSN